MKNTWLVFLLMGCAALTSGLAARANAASTEPASRQSVSQHGGHTARPARSAPYAWADARPGRFRKPSNHAGVLPRSVLSPEGATRPGRRLVAPPKPPSLVVVRHRGLNQGAVGGVSARNAGTLNGTRVKRKP